MNDLDTARGIVNGLGYSLIPWSVVLLVYLSWIEWGY